MDRVQTRKKYTQPRDFVNSAARSGCSSCGKNGHSKTDKKCPACSSKCHNCGKLGHWSSVCRSTAVDGTSAAGSHPSGRTSRPKQCNNSRNNTRSQRTLFVGAAPSISGSKETIPNPPKNDDGEDRSFNLEIPPDSPSVTPDSQFAGISFSSIDSAAGSFTTEQRQHLRASDSFTRIRPLLPRSVIDPSCPAVPEIADT
ncbi:MAG: hypothetical protein GY801_09835, partial [bacterium]|nr:hypothetical protein [bacterium]